uniref:Putative ovule protein n=1 Tax=Solanum chacoense TaxID=4108 RepID=A0A0V0HGI4_SOLCH
MSSSAHPKLEDINVKGHINVLCLLNNVSPLSLQLHTSDELYGVSSPYNYSMQILKFFLLSILQVPYETYKF